jgi:hypothetical protein
VRAFVWILLFALSLPALAQERLTATVDKNTVRVGEAVTLTLTFEGSASGASQPKLPALENLDVVGGPYTSTSFSLVNGRASSTASYSYVLRAKSPGKGVIGPASARFRGRDFTSNPITVTILVASAPAPGGGTPGSGSTADAFIRVYPDQTTASMGEQITLTYKLYFAVQITSPEIIQLPRATGFWVEDITIPQTLPLTDEVVNGRGYKVAVIRKSALFPTAMGDLEVEPMVIQTKVEKQTRRRSPDPFDLFNDPFFQLGRQFEPLELSSPSVTLHVRPLPQTGAPSDFGGAVGSYRIRAAFDRESCKTDEAVTLTVEIEGTGNIKTLPEPKLTVPADVQRFDPDVSDDIRRNQTRIGGRKIFKYVIIPRAPGTQVIPPISYAFYDPDRDRYSTVSTSELRLQVEKGSGVPGMPSRIAVASKQGVENVGTDIAFAKTSPGRFLRSSGLPHQDVLFWLWTASPWAAFAAVGIVSGNRRKSTARGRKRTALKAVARHMAQAERALKTGKPESVLHSAAEALDGLFSAALDRSATGMTELEVEAEWKSHGLDPLLLEKLKDAQAECDRGRFTTGGLTAEGMKSILRSLRSAAAEMERNNGGTGRRP